MANRSPIGGEIFHPVRNSAYSLEWGVGVEKWTNNAFVWVAKINAKTDAAVLFRNKDDLVNPFSGLDDFSNNVLSFK